MARVRSAAVVAVTLCLATCGGSDGPSQPSPPPSSNPFQVTIAGNVATPTDIVVPPGTRVLFVNNDSRRHDMTSDDHPDHLECPAINSVGLLQPGQSRETGNLVAVRTCGFHDHENPDVATLRGRIVIRP
jgi:plastocyanin